LIVTSAPGNRREKPNFVTVADRIVETGRDVVDRREHFSGW